jgi:hypothetical protein
MLKPVIAIVAGFSAIVTNVWRVSQHLYELIDGIKNAPRHICAISEVVQGFYIVLGSLQGLLRDLDAVSQKSNLNIHTQNSLPKERSDSGKRGPPGVTLFSRSTSEYGG